MGLVIGIVLGFLLGFLVSWLVAAFAARKAMKDFNKLAGSALKESGLWVETNSKDSQVLMADTVRRVAELDKARHIDGQPDS